MAKTIWTADPVHSEIQFRVRHLMISTVTGYFKKFDIQVVTEEEDFNSATKILFTADLNSIETNNAQRDTHLKSEDFFSAEKYPQIKFEGKKFDNISDEKYKLTGDLTIRDVTKTVSVDVDFGGIVKDPWGNIRAGFHIDGKISRKEFGLKWNAVTEAGQVVVSDEIKLHGEVELVKQQVAEKSEEAMKEEVVA
jgi:polyisoprenoid-binding protein YceI